MEGQMREVPSKLILLGLALALPPGGLTQAQNQSLASTMTVNVFPADGQDSGQQSKDEVECYEWAAGNTGVDPFDLADKEQANEQQAQAEMEAAESAGQGAGARGAVRGAAAGCVGSKVRSMAAWNRQRLPSVTST
jgi:hypothetical protein